MTSHEIVDGVRLLSHQTDSLELSCALDQIPLLMKVDPVAQYRLDEKRRGSPDDSYVAPSLCNLEARLTGIAEHGEKLNLNGERGTGWSWERSASVEPVRLLPSVARRGQAFALETEDWIMFVAPLRSVVPRLSFQMRSHYLLSVGALGAFEAVKSWCEENVLGLLNGVPIGSVPKWTISRLDLAADLAGVDLKASDLECFINRARFKREHHGPETATGNHRGRRFTGFEFGKRGAGMYARIYDKTVEADKKALIREVWKESGYRPEEHGSTVWRVEFEIRSKLLRDLVRKDEPEDKKDNPEDDEDNRRLNDDPAKTLGEDLDDLWRLAVEEWLVLKSRTGATRVARRPVRDWWDQLATIDRKLSLSGSSGMELSRQPAVSKDPQSFLESSLRSLASYALLEDAPAFSDCLRDLKDLHENSGRQQGFSRLIARAESRRDPSLSSSRVAITLRAEELTAGCGFTGTKFKRSISKGPKRYRSMSGIRRRWQPGSSPTWIRQRILEIPDGSERPARSR